MKGFWVGLVLAGGFSAAGAWGQGGGDAVIARMYHPAGPLAAFEVATVKKADPDAVGAPLRTEGGWVSRQGGPLRTYILSAFGASALSRGQLVGGPAWVSSEPYVIQAKASDETRAAMDRMREADREATYRQMQQSVLMDRFKLKAHFETREMQVYELEPAKGGLKLREVAPPPAFDRNGGPPPPPPPAGSGPPPLVPGLIMMRRQGAISTAGALALDMHGLIDLLRSTPEVDGRPIADKTGFAGNFDVVDLKWAGIGAGSEVDAPGLFTALEERLGLKLRATRGMVEVMVIDSIERPTEN